MFTQIASVPFRCSRSSPTTLTTSTTTTTTTTAAITTTSYPLSASSVTVKVSPLTQCLPSVRQWKRFASDGPAPPQNTKAKQKAKAKKKKDQEERARELRAREREETPQMIAQRELDAEVADAEALAASKKAKKMKVKGERTVLRPRELVISFKEEKEKLRPLLPPSISAERAAVISAKPKKTAEQLHDLFFYRVHQNDAANTLVTYYDYKALAQPTKLMCEYMLLHAGVTQDNLVMKNVYEDLKNIKYLQWDLTLITLTLKAFSLFGEMESMLLIFERLYAADEIPSQVHMECMLKGAARCGDAKHFARFYHRFPKKTEGNKPLEKELLQGLLLEWGSSENWIWKRSKTCNTHTYDYVYMVDIAIRAHNYKRAVQFVNDVFNLDEQPTPQLYEALLHGVKRDFYSQREVCREWLLKLRRRYLPLDKETIAEFDVFTKDLLEFITPEKAENVVTEIMPKKVMQRTTRKRRAELAGVAKNKTRYVSRYTDDSKLLDFVPQYKQRLLDEADAKQLAAERAAKLERIAREVAAAKAKKDAWDDLGFEGDVPLDDMEEY